MILPVLIMPDRRLKKRCYEVEEINEETWQLLDDLYETMQAHDGIGIAACQVGVLAQICVIQVEEEDEVLELINPRILYGTGETLDIEGCLSLPETYGTVKRFTEITVEYYDREGELMEMTASGYLARCVQHEVDHLQGILFTEKMVEAIPPEKIEEWMEEHFND